MDIKSYALSKRYTQSFGVINVKDYGTDGESIISALSDAKAGDTVLMDAVTYVTTKTIKVPFGVTLLGRGRDSKIKLADEPDRNLDSYWWPRTGVTGYPIIVNDLDDTGFSDDVELRNSIQGDSPNFVNFAIEGNTDQKSPSGERIIGLLISNVENGTVDRVYVENIDYFPDGGVDGFGIVTRYCNNITMHNPSGKNCGYENFGIYDNSKNVTVYNPFFGDAGRTSGQVHRGVKNIKVIGGLFKNTEQVNPNDERPGAMTLHGNELSPIHNVTFDGTVFETTGEDTGTTLHGFGTQFNTRFKDVKVSSENYRCVEIYGNGTYFSGVVDYTGTGYAFLAGGTDMIIDKIKLKSDADGLSCETPKNFTLKNFDIRAKDVAIRNDRPDDSFIKGGYIESQDGRGIFQNSGSLTGFYVVDNCYIVTHNNTALSLFPDVENRDKTIIKNCFIQREGSLAVDIMHSKAKFENNTVIGSFRLRDNSDCLVRFNDLRDTNVIATEADHLFIDNLN